MQVEVCMQVQDMMQVQFYGMFYKNKKEKGRLKKEGYKYRVPILW